MNTHLCNRFTRELVLDLIATDAQSGIDCDRHIISHVIQYYCTCTIIRTWAFVHVQVPGVYRFLIKGDYLPQQLTLRVLRRPIVVSVYSKRV